MRRLASRVLIFFVVCVAAQSSSAAEDPITTLPWREVVLSVTDLNRTASFFQDIGGYQHRWRGRLSAALIESWGLPADAGGEALLLQSEPAFGGMIRLVRFDNAGARSPMRPALAAGIADVTSASWRA